jgi:hypothetical protein
MTEHVPVPLVIVYVAPELLHDPELVNTTASPELAVAATVKLPPYASLAGAFVVNVIVCGASVAFTVCVTCAAAA